MTRDMDHIRSILLDLEAFEQRFGGVTHLVGENFNIESHDAEQIEYHLPLIEEAGLIEYVNSRPMRGIMFRRLSNAGHNFLDATRDKTVWEKTKQTATRAGDLASISWLASPRNYQAELRQADGECTWLLTSP